jgi:hypothetical protein
MPPNWPSPRAPARLHRWSSRRPERLDIGAKGLKKRVLGTSQIYADLDPVVCPAAGMPVQDAAT